MSTNREVIFFKSWYNHTVQYYVPIKIREYMCQGNYMKLPILFCLDL